jgi:hypothetical protein
MKEEYGIRTPWILAHLQVNALRRDAMILKSVHGMGSFHWVVFMSTMIISAVINGDITAKGALN